MSGEDAPDQDGEMAAQLQRGDATGVEALYDKYGRLAFGLAFRILNDRTAAEDVVQEAFLGLWRNAGSFDSGRGNLRGWLLSIVHNRAIDRLRGTTRMRKETQIETVERLVGAPDAWETVSAHLERSQIREGFASLPQSQRQTLELAYFGGYTHLEIAGKMGVPLGTVKGRMRMGLEKMRTFLQARGVTAWQG
jgi:RNA polymerase sigma-70 factor (ECF subfamily)